MLIWDGDGDGGLSISSDAFAAVYIYRLYSIIDCYSEHRRTYTEYIQVVYLLGLA
jgi:hypothetical protein